MHQLCVIWAQLCAQLGLPCLDAPGEAEVVCAQLHRRGKVHAVLSSDADVLAMCTAPQYKLLNVSASNMSACKMEVIKADALDMGPHCHQAFAVARYLTGNSSYAGLDGVGPAEAFKVVEALLQVRVILLFGPPVPAH